MANEATTYLPGVTEADMPEGFSADSWSDQCYFDRNLTVIRGTFNGGPAYIVAKSTPIESLGERFRVANPVRQFEMMELAGG